VTIGDELTEAERLLAEAGIPTARGDAEWLAAAALGERRSSVLLHLDRPVSDGFAGRFAEMLARRRKREPLSYVIGTCVFRGIELEVGPGVLVPRPETEITAERAIARARERQGRPTVVDVGTGSGAIALAMAAELPNARIFATESAGAARGWALRNLARTGLRCTLLPGSLLTPLHPALGGCVDVVVSNPPYIAEPDWEQLEPEVRFEPRDAVIAGPTGLEIIRELLDEVRLWITPGGWLVLEVGPSQAIVVSDLLESAGYAEVTVTQDLAGRDRVVEGRWTGIL
jgi:release factor glutamine methyltransferase